MIVYYLLMILVGYPGPLSQSIISLASTQAIKLSLPFDGMATSKDNNDWLKNLLYLTIIYLTGNQFSM